MSEQTDQGILDFIKQQPTSDSNESLTADTLSKYTEQLFKVSKKEKILLMDKYGEVFEYKPSKWQKLDWELIKN